LLLVRERWWICAAAGWAVTAATLVARRRLPEALLAGAGTALLSGSAQYLRDLLTGHSGHSLGNLVGFLRVPVWILLALVVLTLPLAMLLPGTVPAGTRLRWFVPATALVSILVATGVLAPVTGRSGDWTRFRAAAQRPRPAQAPSTTDPGRTLTGAQAHAILARVREALPPGWAPVANLDTHPDRDVRPAGCAARWTQDDAAAVARHPLADEKVTAALPKDRWQPLGATLILGLTSLPTPATARSILDEAATDVTLCPQWTVASPSDDRGRMRLSLTAAPPPALPGPAYRIRATGNVTVHGRPLCIGNVQSWALVGHNVVTASALYSAPDHAALSAAQWSTLDGLVLASLQATVNALRR
ncbi:MAG TPA: hypothetical protein VJT31_03205, partial [Rugosimonospora sp.]|nr:hypothetical protein [Rugosimonospora sp.]